MTPEEYEQAQINAAIDYAIAGGFVAGVVTTLAVQFVIGALLLIAGVL